MSNLDGGSSMAGKYNISSASAKLLSAVKGVVVSPKGVPSCGLVLTKQQAVELATYILAVAGATNATGKIIVTGYPNDDRVTVIRGLK
jgi:hypothetical protein